MGVTVAAAEAARVVLRAPFAINHNQHGTAFGGSLDALAILTGWAWVQLTVEREGLDCYVVIQRSATEFDRPLTTDLEATCEAPALERLAQFLETFRRHGRARLEVGVTVAHGGVTVARFEGAFAALAPRY
jgi:thioesterase domain-containing protein